MTETVNLVDEHGHYVTELQVPNDPRVEVVAYRGEFYVRQAHQIHNHATFTRARVWTVPPE